MPVPSAITDLSTTAASNYPAGSDSPTSIDDVLRAHAAFIAQLYGGTVNITLGDASGDTITVNAGSVSCPNGLNFDSNTLVLDSANNKVGVKNATPTTELDVTGRLRASQIFLGDAAGSTSLIGSAPYFYSQSAGAVALVTGSAVRFEWTAGGNHVIYNTSGAPSTVSGAGVLYVESGALKYRGSGGTVTTLAAA